MGKWLSIDKDLPKRPLILCTWYSDGEWHTYERLAFSLEPESAYEETAKAVLWSSHPTFEMQLVEYR